VRLNTSKKPVSITFYNHIDKNGWELHFSSSPDLPVTTFVCQRFNDLCFSVGEPLPIPGDAAAAAMHRSFAWPSCVFVMINV